MRKTLIILAILFLPAGISHGAVKYFDSTCATPGDGTSPVCSGSTAPFDQFSDTTIASTDFLLCKGTFTEQITLTNVTGVAIYPYDSTGCVIDGQNTQDYGISADRTTNLTVGPIEIKNATRNGIKVFTGTAATTISGVRIIKTNVHDIGPGTVLPFSEYEVEKGTCIFLRTNTSSTAIIDGVSIEGTVTYNCGKHGIDFRFQVRNVVVDNATVHDTGLTATGHGISVHPWKETATSWTQASGNVYYRNRFSANDQEQRIVDQTSRRVFTLNTSSTTNPGVYEWATTSIGVGACTTAGTTGCIYANIGGPNPGTMTISVKRFRHGPFLIKNSVAYNIDSGVDTAEGHGFDADDLSGPVTFLNNKSYENYGNGFMTFFGENVRFIGNISMNNGGSGLYTYLCTTCQVINNTLHSNDDIGLYDGGAENYGLKVYNNIFTNNTTRSAGLTGSTTGSSGFAQENNIAWNNVTNNVCNGFTCIQADPHYVGGVDPTTVNGLKLFGSTYGSDGTPVLGGEPDFAGREFDSGRSIGAFQYGYRDFTSRN